MKKSQLAPILCILFTLPVLIHAQEPASCDFNYGSYKELTPIPVGSSSPAIGLIGGKIYLSSGYDWGDYKNLYTPDHLQVYDPETDSWDTTGARIPVPRAIYGGGDMALDGKLYSIRGLDWVNLGGGNWQMVPHASVDVYDPQLNSWELKANLPVPIGGNAICSLNDKLYVTGGVSTDQVLLNSLFCYDPGTDKWTELSSMETPRLFHVSVSLDGKIYVLGGSDTNNLNIATKACSVYDPDLDQWTSIAPLPRTSVLGAAGVIDGEIYLFGGSSTGPGDPVGKAHKYNPEMDAWIEIDDMKNASKEHVLVSIGRTFYIFGIRPNNFKFTNAYKISDIRLDAMIPDGTIDGNAVEMDLSGYFSHLDGGEITYSVCLGYPDIVETSIEGSMLTIIGLSKGNVDVNVLAESGEDQMADVYKVNVTSPTVGIDESSVILPTLRIYPNPAREMATLAYLVRSPGVVRLEIYDMLGKKVTIPMNEYKGTGEYKFQFSTLDLESGVYFCDLVTATERITAKLIVGH